MAEVGALCRPAEIGPVADRQLLRVKAPLTGGCEMELNLAIDNFPCSEKARYAFAKAYLSKPEPSKNGLMQIVADSATMRSILSFGAFVFCAPITASDLFTLP